MDISLADISIRNISVVDVSIVDISAADISVVNTSVANISEVDIPVEELLDKDVSAVNPFLVLSLAIGWVSVAWTANFVNFLQEFFLHASCPHGKLPYVEDIDEFQIFSV